MAISVQEPRPAFRAPYGVAALLAEFPDIARIARRAGLPEREPTTEELDAFEQGPFIVDAFASMPLERGKLPDIDDPFVRYLEEAGRHPLLKLAEEIACTKLIWAASVADRLHFRDPALTAVDQLGFVDTVNELHETGLIESLPVKRAELSRLRNEAKERLILANLRLVTSIAMSRSGLPTLDLIQEGNIGLIRAIDKFDPRKEYKFSTYATWWICEAMSYAVAEKSRMIRLPRRILNLGGEMRLCESRLCQDLGRMPTSQEVAAAMRSGTTPEVVEQLKIILSVGWLAVTLDGHKPSVAVPDHAANGSSEAFAAAELEADLSPLLSVLTRREREVIELRTGFLNGEGELTQRQTAKLLGLTGSRVSQIEAGAREKLKIARTLSHAELPSDSKTVVASRDLGIAAKFLGTIEQAVIAALYDNHGRMIGSPNSIAASMGKESATIYVVEAHALAKLRVGVWMQTHPAMAGELAEELARTIGLELTSEVYTMAGLIKVARSSSRIWKKLVTIICAKPRFALERLKIVV